MLLSLSFNTFNIHSNVNSSTYPEPDTSHILAKMFYLQQPISCVLRLMILSCFGMSHLLFLTTIYGLQQKQLNSKRVQQLRT